MKVLLIVFLLTALGIYAGPIEDLQAGRWYEAPNSHLYDVRPDGWSANVIVPWSSGAFDTKRDRYIIWGGGHGDYAGNEIYIFDLNTLRWQRLTDPCPNTGGGEGTGEYPLWNNTVQPRSRHTYEYIEYVPSMDRFCTWGGSGQYPQGGIVTDRVHCFNFETNLWERKPPTESYGIGAFSAYDPVTGHAWAHGMDSHCNFSYFAPEEGSYGTWHKVIDQDTEFRYKYRLTGALDPKRRLFVAVGGGDVYTWNISNESSPVKSKISTSGATSAVGGESPGLAYDPVTEKMVAWNGGQTVYSLDLDSRTWSSHSGGGANPGSPTSTGTFGRWRYSPNRNVFIIVNNKSANVFIYRHTSDASAPQWYLDMLENTSVSEVPDRIAEKQIIRVSPNPFQSKIKIAISYQLPAISEAKLDIFNVNGKIVKELTADNRQLKAGISWNATNQPPGIYIVRVMINNRTYTRRIVLAD
jgi:hypothetical protein